MKSSVNCFDVSVDNSIETMPKHSIHAGCYGVSMIEPKSSMCARTCVCAHEIIETSKHRNKPLSMRF